MQLAATIPGVRLPKVHDAWEIGAHLPRKYFDVNDENFDDPANWNITTYILMDYIQGDCLADLWPTLPTEHRSGIRRQVCDLLDALHHLVLLTPGPVGGGKSRGFWFTDYDAGPFVSKNDLEQWFNERLQVCKNFGRVAKGWPGFTGRFKELVMCHMDLHTRNIILDGQGRVWLVDWDYAGAYPVFFEEAFFKESVDCVNPDFVTKLHTMMSGKEHQDQIRHLAGIGFAVTTGAMVGRLRL